MHVTEITMRLFHIEAALAFSGRMFGKHKPMAHARILPSHVAIEVYFDDADAARSLDMRTFVSGSMEQALTEAEEFVCGLPAMEAVDA